jgi:RNA polymerase primary sigma factor
MRLYLRDIGRYPQLTHDEEVALGKRMDAGRAASSALTTMGELPCEERAEIEKAIASGHEATRQFVLCNLRLVVALAKRRRAATQSLLDAVADGNLGLLKAVERYDWRCGFKFSTHATWWIHQAISRGARLGRALTMSSNTDLRVRSVYRTRSHLEAALGRAPTIDELAAASGSSPALVVRYLTIGEPAIQLDAPLDGNTPMEEMIPDSTPTASEQVPADLIRTQVHRLLCRLQPEERRIVEMRFGLDDGAGRTYAEVGAVIGVSAERIRQIEVRAFARLRRTPLGQQSLALLAG